MRVLVTGGAGFIGANLVRHLVELDQGHEVVVVDDLSTGRQGNLDGLDCELHIGSILDADLMDKASAGADTVVHLAARASVPRSLADPVATAEVNVMGTVRVLEAARANGVPHLVFAGSSSVYGANPALPKKEDLAPSPISPYGASKLAAEGFALSYGPSFGMEVLAFRFFNVYGPLQPADHAYAAVIPRFVDAAVCGRSVEVFGDGRQTRDFTYVRSVVEIISDAIERRIAAPRPVNLAFGSRASLLDVVELLERSVGQPLSTVHLEPRLGDVRDSQADSEALHALFPDARPVSLAVGLAETMQWAREALGEKGADEALPSEGA